MLLSHRTSVKIRPEYSNIIGHMCYAASKLWNVCNYERHHYKELGLEKYPDWYYQKKAHKGDLWYKQLPSQTAQETCKQLDKAWRSFYVLKKTGGIKDPNPPRFKQGNIPVQGGAGVHRPDVCRLLLERLHQLQALHHHRPEAVQLPDEAAFHHHGF